MKIDVNNISKTFDSFKALHHINLNVASGELLALLGPSGSGKTTLLRIIAGLEAADEAGGGVYFDGKNVTFKSAKDREVGFVFQHYALFRHMSVFENIAFGLRVRPTSTRPSNAEIRDRVMKLLHLVQLDGLEKRFPTQLSGGQRQRVALARALAVEPKVLLLDEPFGALDAKVRKELRRWLRKLHEEIHVTSIFVTHDQEEALELADRVVIMNLGQIEQVGTPEQVYDMPANSFVYQFLGSVNTLAASVLEGKASIGGQTFTVENGSQNESDGVAFIRPHEFELLKAPNGGPALPGRVRHIQPVGSVIRVEVLRDDTHESLDVEVTREHFKNLGLKVHDKAWLRPHRVQVYPPDFSI